MGSPPIKGRSERVKDGGVFVAESTVASHSPGLALCMFLILSTSPGPSFPAVGAVKVFGGTFCLFLIQSPSSPLFCPGIGDMFVRA